MVLGGGFPRFHGGPMKWADMRGLAQVLTQIETFSAEGQAIWSPAPLLQQLVADARSFDDLNEA